MLNKTEERLQSRLARLISTVIAQTHRVDVAGPTGEVYRVDFPGSPKYVSFERAFFAKIENETLDDPTLEGMIKKAWDVGCRRAGATVVLRLVDAEAA